MRQDVSIGIGYADRKDIVPGIAVVVVVPAVAAHVLRAGLGLEDKDT